MLSKCHGNRRCSQSWKERGLYHQTQEICLALKSDGSNKEVKWKHSGQGFCPFKYRAKIQQLGNWLKRWLSVIKYSKLGSRDAEGAGSLLPVDGWSHRGRSWDKHSSFLWVQEAHPSDGNRAKEPSTWETKNTGMISQQVDDVNKILEDTQLMDQW
jgi:hypothetical protein